MVQDREAWREHGAGKGLWEPVLVAGGWSWSPYFLFSGHPGLNLHNTALSFIWDLGDFRVNSVNGQETTCAFEKADRSASRGSLWVQPLPPHPDALGVSQDQWPWSSFVPGCLGRK